MIRLGAFIWGIVTIFLIFAANSGNGEAFSVTQSLQCN